MRTREFLRRLHAGGLAGCLLYSGLAAPVSANPEAPWPVDTQPGGRPTPPTATAPAFQLSPGFEIRLAAAEPDVRQPIALAYDHRGRLWVAECYSYAGSDFTAEARDRIVIFEDRDGDGVFDSRRIFHDQLNRLTGLTLGFGGVWVATAPTVAFIPDRDGDDRPDGPAEPVLDGFTLRAEHNSVNGLTWGPDGWLYGRHGIKQPSRVGLPGSAPEQRITLSAAIWRYHPTRRTFEVFCDGTINPWGLDFDDFGEAFFSTSVVDHLWHAVPGARFERWKNRGGHPNPATYEWMTATSDHLHWGGGAWDANGRTGAGNDALGGGHSHSDAMIYLGDRWPDEFRGSVFLSNIHGRRINRDRLVQDRPDLPVRARHAPDFLRTGDPWFRAVSLVYGPSGDVVFSDWSDQGECHDRDGVHRSSGRLYTLSYGAPRRLEVNLRDASTAALVEFQFHRNDWFVRQARLILQERAAAGEDPADAVARLRREFDRRSATPERLRALWALAALGSAPDDWLRTQLTSDDAHLRAWAIRLLGDRMIDADSLQAMTQLAATETAWLPRLWLAASLQRPTGEDPWPLARALLRCLQAADEPNLERLLWYGLEPLVLRHPEAVGREAARTASPRLRRFLARRLAEAAPAEPGANVGLFAALAGTDAPEILRDLLTGSLEGLAGRTAPPAPPAANRVWSQLRSQRDPDTLRLVHRLGARYGERTSLETLRSELTDPTSPEPVRQAILTTLLETAPDGLADDLLGFVAAGRATAPTITALARLGDPRTPDRLLQAYPAMAPTVRTAVIDALTSRAAWAHALLEALQQGRIARADVTALQARQIQQLGDAALSTTLENVWGRTSTTSTETAAALQRWRGLLSPAVLAQGSLDRGRTLFEQRCAACHVLFGNGRRVGPDLTGSGRHDLEYLLLNLIDPNATIPADYRLAVVKLKDGQVLSGTLAATTADPLVLRTLTEEHSLPRASVENVNVLPVSLMPAGLLDDLEPTAARDLIAYLMTGAAPSP